MKLSKNKIKFIKFIFFGIIFVAGCVLLENKFSENSRRREVIMGGEVFMVEVVRSKNEKEKGLFGREELCLNCGMLFEFSKPGKYGFWMKDMNFPLDFVWILDNRIVYVNKNIAKNFSEVIFPPNNIDSVLEIPAGLLDKYKIKVGDEISMIYE
ncbi:MAG: hypothetical protein US66_C0002G0028 [Candidatus Moranbacteria bacterium GW2011_GWD2_37_9]|nr:MAG: hypothetical protein US66_C0002G0028 [Candidatus Moranbacteria bacterium GW2011_GWD2_37_9]